MMQKILLFSHNGFSDENANGITMKNLLSAWSAEEKAEFYCGTEVPDFSAAHAYFRITDIQAAKSFFGKKSWHIFSDSAEKSTQTQSSFSGTQGRTYPIPAWLKKYKYNFFLKWIREYLWILGPWGHREFAQWLAQVSPDVIIYMVGESIFMDRMVLKVCEKTGKPLVLYNGEAYRIIDLRTRHGLERAYYRKVEGLYEKLSRYASLIVYNCEMLKRDYEARYTSPARTMIAYNSADSIPESYQPSDGCVITYFGNLGVGRSEELIRFAKVLEKVDPTRSLNIYGNATKAQAARFQECQNIRYHGFVDARKLRKVIAASDILVHVETFEEATIPKLRYAFSTKIAQCLCAGRCLISFAPQEMASSQYLNTAEGAIVVSSEADLEKELLQLLWNPLYRAELAEKAYRTGLQNHQIQVTSRRLRREIDMGVGTGL